MDLCVFIAISIIMIIITEDGWETLSVGGGAADEGL